VPLLQPKERLLRLKERLLRPKMDLICTDVTSIGQMVYQQRPRDTTAEFRKAKSLLADCDIRRLSTLFKFLNAANFAAARKLPVRNRMAVFDS